MRVTTVDGSIQEITMEEAKRIFHEVRRMLASGHTHHDDSVHESEMDYHNRAYHNICERAAYHGIHHVEDTEHNMKELFLAALDLRDADMLGEIIEWFISEHGKKVGA